jgi:hypothetical protein
MRGPKIPISYSHDMQMTGKARTAPPRILDYIGRQIESNGYLTIDSLIEETKTHILVGLFLLCKDC